MGWTDRLSQILEGVVNVAITPVATAVDLVRAIPDPNMSFGNALGGGANRFVGGLVDISEGTGLAGVGRETGEKTQIDETIGRIFTELELYYSSGLQEEMQRTPFGVAGIGEAIDPYIGGDQTVRPGDLSIQRVLGTGTGVIGDIAGMAPILGGKGGNNFDSLATYWREARNYSPGQIFEFNRRDMWSMTKEEVDQITSSTAYNLTTGTMDFLLRFRYQPEVILGAGYMRARAKFRPDMAADTRTFQRIYGMDAVKVDYLVSTKPPDMDALLRPHVERFIGDRTSPSRTVDPSHVDRVTAQMAERSRIVNGGLEFLDDPTQPYDFPELKAVLGNISPEELNLPTPEFGGAVHMQITGARGQSLLHVTRESHYQAMINSGILRIPPGADELLEASVIHNRLYDYLEETAGRKVTDVVDDVQARSGDVGTENQATINAWYREALDDLEADPRLTSDESRKMIEAGHELLQDGSISDPDAVIDFIKYADDVRKLDPGPRDQMIAIIARISEESRLLRASTKAHGNDVSLGATTRGDVRRAPETPIAEKGIHLLAEGEEDEALRYAAALHMANPADPPVILTINPEGLPVFFEDFMDPSKLDMRRNLPRDASLMTRVDKIGPDKIIEVRRPTASNMDIGAMSTFLEGGQTIPKYLEPGGRVHERMYRPDGSPIEPDSIVPWESVRESTEAVTQVYNTQGEAAAVQYLKALDAQRERDLGLGGPDYPSWIMNRRSTQRFLNSLEGKSTTEIHNLYFHNVVGGGPISNLLAEAPTYAEKWAIVASSLGMVIPEQYTLRPGAQVRINALLRGVNDETDEIKRLQDRMTLQAVIDDGEVNEILQVSLKDREIMKNRMTLELAEEMRVEDLGKWLQDIRKYAPLRTRPRSTVGTRFRESTRQTTWYQSGLGRPLRSVVEKRPHNHINLGDPEGHQQIARQMQMGRQIGVTRAEIDDFQTRYIAATTEVEKRIVLQQMDEHLLRKAAARAKLDPEELLEIVNKSSRGRRTSGQILASRRFAPDGMDVVMVPDPDSAQFIEMAMPLIGTQLQNWETLTDVRALVSASTRVRRLRNRFGSKYGMAMDTFYHLWKPSVLLRGGWPIRVVADEQLRTLVRTGSLLRHLAAIEAGKVPNPTPIFRRGQTVAQFGGNMLGTFSLASPIVAAGSATAHAISFGARKLKLVDPQYWDDIKDIGYEHLASAKSAVAGPNRAANEAFASIVGEYEAGMMDNILAQASGQWGSKLPDDPMYGRSWQRVLQAQLGQDELSKVILEAVRDMGYEPISGSNILRVSLADYFDEAGLPFPKKELDSLAEFIGKLQDNVSTPEAARQLDFWVGFNDLDIDPVTLRELSMDLGDNLPLWRDGAYDPNIKAGGHAGGRAKIETGVERVFGAHNIAFSERRFSNVVDDIYQAYEYYNFDLPANMPQADMGRLDFEDWWDSYIRNYESAFRESLIDPKLGLDIHELVAEMSDSIGDWLPVNPRAHRGVAGNPKNVAREWLTNTPDGQTYGKRMLYRYNDVPAWVEDVTGMLEYYTADFDPRLVDAVLAGRVPMKLLESIDEARRPASVHSEIVDQGLGVSGVTRFVNEFLTTSYDLMGRLPTDTLSRQPMFKQLYGLEMGRLRSLNAAQGVEMTEELLQKMGGQSRQYALREVNKWLYNLAEQSRFGSMMRWHLPFFNAWQEVLTVWLGLARHDPRVIGRGLLLWRAPNKAGMVETDDEGNEYIVFRLSERMADKMDLTGWQRFAATGSLAFNKRSFNLLLNSPLPSVGPPIAWPINEVVKNKPSWEESLRWLLPFGVRQNVGEVILSPILRKAGALVDGVDGDRTFVRDTFNIMVWEDHRYRAGERTDPPTMDEIISSAQRLFMLRTAFNLIAPAQPIIRTPLEPYAQAWHDLQEMYGYDIGLEKFLNEYGTEYFGVTLPRTFSKTGIPPTVEAQEAREQFEELIARYPTWGRLIIGAEASMGEFSSAAFAWQMTNPIPGTYDSEPERSYRELELDLVTGTITEIDRRLGWNEYIRYMDLIDIERRSRGLPNLAVKEAQDLAAIKAKVTESIGAEYPEWFRDFNDRDDLKWDTTLKTLRTISSSPLMDDRPDMRGVREYFKKRELILNELNRRKQTGGASTLEATSNQDLALAWEALIFSTLEENVAFVPIYYRYLEGDPVSLRVRTVTDAG